MALYTCAASRAVHLHLFPDMTAKEFKRHIQRSYSFAPGRGQRTTMISDNRKTFAAKQDGSKTETKPVGERLFERKNIHWEFNVSRSPWCGEFFERMVGLMEAPLTKTVRRANLTFELLQEVPVN